MQGAQNQYQSALNSYNAQNANNNAFNSGLFGLGAAGITAFSDRRLKSSIVRVGTHPLGIGIYDYDIFGHRERGVMADEVELVRPHAVTIHESGYRMVNYAEL